MNRIPLYRRREPWTTGLAAALGLLAIAALLGWLWRPAKTAAVPPAASSAASAPAASGPGSAVSQETGPAQARRQLAVAGRWSRLTARDKVILAPLEEDWSELNTDQRLKWLELSSRFHSLTPDEQLRVQERMAQWARMSTAERGAARLNFQELRQISQRERLEQWEAYQGLKPEEKKGLAIKAQAAAQSPAVPRRAEPSAPVPKSSGSVAEVLAGSPGVARPVSGTLVQAPMGATTTLVTQVPPAGLTPAPTGPKIAAQPSSVDPVTLLPQARPGRAPAAAESAVGAAGEDSGSNPASTESPTTPPSPAPSTSPATVPAAASTNPGSAGGGN